MSEKKYYAVLELRSEMEILGQTLKLPKGQYFLPVFDSIQSALDHAHENSRIIELSVDTERKNKTNAESNPAIKNSKKRK